LNPNVSAVGGVTKEHAGKHGAIGGFEQGVTPGKQAPQRRHLAVSPHTRADAAPHHRTVGKVRAIRTTMRRSDR
jgi:hypothetical protein